MKKAFTIISVLGIGIVSASLQAQSVSNLEAIEEQQREEVRSTYGDFYAKQQAVLESVRTKAALAASSQGADAAALETTIVSLLNEVYESNNASIKNGYTAIAEGGVEGIVKFSGGDVTKLNAALPAFKSALFKASNTFAKQQKINQIVVARYYPFAMQKALSAQNMTADISALKAEAVEMAPSVGIDGKVLQSFLAKASE